MKIIPRNYGSIPHLSSSKLGEGDHFIEKGQERIITEKARDRHDVIFAFEKYDGANVGIVKKSGKIYAITRSGHEASTSPYKQHHLFATWVAQREKYFKELLYEGERIVGEWLVQAHGLRYKITDEPVVFFDLFTSDGKRLPYYDFITHAFYFTLPTARLLHQGAPMSVEKLLPILNEKTPTIESIEQPEGIVFRVERSGAVDFLAKWVRQDFQNGQYCIGVPENELIYNIDISKI